MKLSNLKHMPGNLVETQDALLRRIEALERSLLSAVINPDYAVFNTDVYNVPWTDYSSDSTIVGWSSFTTQEIYYKKIGKLVFVHYRLVGTSDSTSTSFTLPFNAALTMMHKPGIATDNGTQLAGAGYAQIVSGSGDVQFYATESSGAWTASGTKRVVGSFFYEAAF